MKLCRVHADAAGETHLERLDLSRFERPHERAPSRVGIADIPTTTMTITALLERKPDLGLHPAPRRQLVLVLRGVLEVTSTAGETERFAAGDGLLTEDLAGNGHHTRDVGDELLSTITIGIADGWELPST